MKTATSGHSSSPKRSSPKDGDQVSAVDSTSSLKKPIVAASSNDGKREKEKESRSGFAARRDEGDKRERDLIAAMPTEQPSPGRMSDDAAP